MRNRFISLLLVLSFLPLPVSPEQGAPSLSLPEESSWTVYDIHRSLSESLSHSDLNLLLTGMDQLEREFLYRTEGGNLLFDSKNDPLLRSSDPAEIEQDRTLYENRARAIQETLLSQWEEKAQKARTVLMTPLSQGQTALSETVERELDLFRQRIWEETDKMICYRLDRFNYFRKKDNFSLRRKSEDQTALMAAAELTERVNDETREILQILEKPLDRESGAAVSQASFSPDSWEESFDREFRKGLEKWQKAEEEILSGRIDWELELSEKYRETEAAWDRSMQIFSDTRKAWIEEMKDLYRTGLNAWDLQQEEYQEKFETMARQMEEDSIRQEEIFLSRVTESLDIYRESLQYRDSAEKNIQYYQSKIRELEDLKANSRNRIDSIETGMAAAMFAMRLNEGKLQNSQVELQDLQNTLELLQNERQEIGDDLDAVNGRIEDSEDLEEELQDLLEKQQNLRERLIEVNEQIEDTENGIVTLESDILREQRILDSYYTSYAPQLNAIALERGYIISYDIKRSDFLKEKETWESLSKEFSGQMKRAEEDLISLQAEAGAYDTSVPSSSLEQEIARMELVTEYLFHQLAVSEAVMEYASQDTSLRPRDSQTQEDYDEALSSLEEGEREYLSFQSRLDSLREDLTGLQEQILAKEKALQETLEAQTEAGKAYEMSQEIYRNSDISLLQAGISSLQDQLDAWFQGKDSAPPERQTLYTEYIHAGQADWVREKEEAARTLLRDLTGEETLMESDNITNTEDLSLLIANLENLDPRRTASAEEWENQLISCGFEQGDYEYEILQNQFGTTPFHRLSLDKALRDLIREQKQKYWNNALLEERLRQEDDPSRNLQEDLDRALNSLLLEKTELMILIGGYLKDGGEVLAPYREYISFLKDQGFRLEQDSLDGLIQLRELLNRQLAGEIGKEELLTLVSEQGGPALWLSYLNGDNSDMPPELSFLDIFPEASYDEVLRARGALFAGECIQQFNTGAEVLFNSSGIDMETLLESLETPEDLRQFYSDFMRDPEIPPSLLSLVEKYLHSRFAGQWEALLADWSGTEERCENLEDLMEGMESNQSDDEKLTLLENNGFSDEVAELRRYRLLESWQTFLKNPDSPDLPEGEMWLLFRNSHETGEIDYETLTSLEVSLENLPPLIPYTSYGGKSLFEHIESHYGDLGFTGRIRMIEELKGFQSGTDGVLWYLEQQLHSRYTEALENREYAAFLERVKSIRRESGSDAHEELFMKERIGQAGDLLRGETSLIAQEDSFETLADRLISMTGLMESREKERNQLQREKDIFAESLSLYKQLIIDQNFEDFTKAKSLYGQTKSEMETLRTTYGELLGEYQTARNAVESSYTRYKKLKLDLQKAEEILDYAGCAYESVSYSIDTLRDQRQQAYDDSLKALEILKSIQLEGKTEIEADAQWAQALEEYRQRLSALNQIGSARENLDEQMDSLTAARERAFSQMGDTLKKVFNQYGQDSLIMLRGEIPTQPMSDCTVFSNGNLGSYFDAENIQEIFTGDACRWLESIKNLNSQEVLKLFTFAYYHEFGGRVNLFSNSQHKNLLDTKGDFFRKACIGYEGDMNTYRSGGYSSREVTRKIHRPDGSIKKVFIKPEVWLKEHTGSYYNRVVNDKSLVNLYSFFKIVMQKGFFLAEMEDSMAMELSDLAWDYLNDVAKDEQEDEKNIFGKLNSLGRDIREKRHAIKKIKNNGGFDGTAKRQTLLDMGAEISNHTSLILGFDSQMKSLMNSGSVTTATLLRDIAQISGSPLKESSRELLKQIFQETGDSYETNRQALQKLYGDLEKICSISRNAVAARENELSSERTILLEQMRVFSRKGDLEKYKDLALNLFESPSYLEGESQIQRGDLLLETPSFSPRGFLNNLNAYGASLSSLYRKRLEMIKQKTYRQLELDVEEFQQRRKIWQQRFQEQMDDGMAQWKLSTERMIGQREKWREQFLREYRSKDSLWTIRMENFYRNRESWIYETTLNACEAGADFMQEEYGLKADQLINQSRYFLIPSVGNALPDVSEILNDAMEGIKVDQILASFSSRNGRISSGGALITPPVSVFQPRPIDARPLLEEQRDLKEKFRKSLVITLAYQMTDALKETETSVQDSIEDANRSTDNSVEDTLVSSGYYRRGNTFSRQIIIDKSVLGGNETETQRIEAFRDFQAPSFDHGVELSVNSLKHLSSTLIQARVEKAQTNMQHYLDLIFGREKDREGNELDIRTGLDEGFLSYLENQETAFRSSAQYNGGFTDENGKWQTEGKHTETAGLFYFHVGYAPEMKEKKPEEVKSEGYGEMGRIFRAFKIHQARMYRGFSVMDMPRYNQKLWDDDADNDGSSDSLVGAPSMRSLTDIAMNIAVSAVLGPGVGNLVLTAALNLVDDALFTALDVQNGQQKSGKAWGDFRRKTAMTAVTTASGAVFQKLDGLTMMSEASGSMTAEVITDTAIAGTQTAVNSTALAAIGNIEDWKSFDTESFQKQASLENNREAYLNGMSGAAVSSLIDTGAFGYIKSMKTNADKLSQLAGGLTSSGMEYALTGETKLNIVNLSMLGLQGKSGLVSSGLLELNLGGSGSLLSIGNGGTDISAGTIGSALRGLEIYQHNREIRESDMDTRMSLAMRTLVSSEMEQTEQQYRDILNHKIAFTSVQESGYDGKTTMNEDGKKSIELNSSDLTSFDLAVLLAHESFRDGVISDKDSQNRETQDAVRSHMDVSSAIQDTYGSSYLSIDNNKEARIYKMYQNGMISKEDLGNYALKNYDSSADYWKFTSDGNIIFDGKKNLYDENGKLLDEYEGNGGFTDSLAAMLGISKKAANQMMVNAGWSWENGTFKANGVDVLNNGNTALNTSDQMKAQYFVQRDYVDKLWSTYAGDMRAMATAMQEDLFIASNDGDFNSTQKHMLDMIPGLQSMGNQLKVALYGDSSHSGMLDQDRFDNYHDSNVSGAFQEIKDNWSYTDDNPMYRLIGDGKPIDPIEGDDYITVWSSYANGNEHGWNGGEAVDFGTDRKNHPLFTTQFETIRTNDFNLGWDKGDINKGTGYTLRSDSDLFYLKYGHMQASSFASSQLQNLINTASQSELWRFMLPPGYQIGNIGNTGHSTGKHLHWEFYPY